MRTRDHGCVLEMGPNASIEKALETMSSTCLLKDRPSANATSKSWNSFQSISIYCIAKFDRVVYPKKGHDRALLRIQEKGIHLRQMLKMYTSLFALGR